MLILIVKKKSNKLGESITTETYCNNGSEGFLKYFCSLVLVLLPEKAKHSSMA